ncbi:TPA: hypothetical protein ACPVYA_004661, partial [Vibrio parahaemolyticus]
ILIGNLMNEVLQIVGSLASIVGIPLAVYLYIKSKAEKHFEVRREIVKRLSYQVGEGREISPFELNVIIDSLVREKKIKESVITPDSVIEDLTSEIVSSPLLDKNRKDTVVIELQKLHSKHAPNLSSQVDDIDWGASEGNSIELEVSEYKAKSGSNRGAEVFAVSATIISALLATYVSSSSGSIIDKLMTIPVDEAATLGAVIATLAGFITGVIDWKKRK